MAIEVAGEGANQEPLPSINGERESLSIRTPGSEVEREVKGAWLGLKLKQ